MTNAMTTHTTYTNAVLVSLQQGLQVFGTLDRQCIQQLWFPSVTERTTQRTLKQWIDQRAIHGTIVYQRLNGQAKRQGMVYHTTVVPDTTVIAPTTALAIDMIHAARLHGGLVGVQSWTLTNTMLGNGRVLNLRWAHDDRYVTPLWWIKGKAKQNQYETAYLLIPDTPHISDQHHYHRSQWYRDLAYQRNRDATLIPLVITTPERVQILGSLWSQQWHAALICCEEPRLRWTHTVWQRWVQGQPVAFQGLFDRKVV